MKMISFNINIKQLKYYETNYQLVKRIIFIKSTNNL